MKPLQILSFIALFMLSLPLAAQSTPSKDKITTFYQSLLDNMESNYLDRNRVDWQAIRTSTLKQALEAKNFEEALKVTPSIFDAIKCNHCQLFSTDSYYASTLNKELSQEDFSIKFLLELEKKPGFAVKLIDQSVGYINIPGMLLIDLTPELLNLETQKMYDKIVDLEKTHKVQGWIVDLRFNIGGNVYPMLASLHYLLGNNVMYTEIDDKGNTTQTNRLVDGGFYSGEKLETKANVSIKPNVTTPVAVIIGKMTASAGEDIAVAFKNRKNTTFIGEASYGFLTGNDLIELPYDNKLALTTSFIADENSVYRDRITPDIVVSKKDDFEDLTKDQNIIQAINFINAD